jgi:hypothetical protein
MIPAFKRAKTVHALDCADIVISACFLLNKCNGDEIKCYVNLTVFQRNIIATKIFHIILLPLWSSGQCSWLQIQRSRLRVPALPDFLRSSGSGTGSTQPREYN